MALAVQHWEVPGQQAEGDPRSGDYLPLDKILTPPQIRQTIDQNWVYRLAQSIIATRGCDNAPIVYQFTEEEFERYLSIVNKLWKADCKVSDYESLSNTTGYFYLPVVAGAMRVRAYRYIWDYGCDTCREEYGEEQEGVCFLRHFAQKQVRVQLRFGDSLEALNEMFSENNYNPPLPNEIADGLGLFLNFIRNEIDPGITLKRFSSKYVGWSPEKVGESRRYLSLPLSIREAVERREMPFGVSIQLARLQEANCPEEELEHFYRRAVTDNWTVAKAHEVVNRKLIQIKNEGSGQSDLETIMGLMQSNVTKRQLYKRAVEINSIRGLHGYLLYMRKVLSMYKSGQLGLEESPFSEDGVLKVLKDSSQVSIEVANHLTNLRDKERAEIKQPFMEVVELVEEITNLRSKKLAGV